MNIISFYDILLVLIPFTLYGVFKFIRWWLIMVWQYNSNHDWFFVLRIPPSMYWIVLTISLIDTKQSVPLEFLFLYWGSFFLGPFTYILAFMRFLNFGNTKVGKLLGCYPPVKI